LRADREEGAETAVVEAKEVLDGAGLETTTAIRDGITHNKITEYVDDHDIDMIVMGTHGRSGLKRALVGSVAEKTMRNSPVPVVMVPPSEQ
jgi:nucleotide-binding universal stress UspA family protein